MTADQNAPFNLRAHARQAMAEAGFTTDLSSDAADELRRLEGPGQPEATASSVRDLRSLLWSSIDNEESRDLDQVEFAEREPNGNIRLRVAIADVDVLVPQGSALDRHAAASTTSVYTGIETFPMLPERLSNDLTSLREGQDRHAVVSELSIRPDGVVAARQAYRAWVRNQAKLVYESVGAWLEGGSPPDRIARDPALEAQVRLQDEAMTWVRALRRRSGALDFETIEATPVMKGDTVVDLAVKAKNRARYIVESFMIAVNTATAAFLAEKGWPAIQRVVHTPKRWPRIVEIAADLGERLPPEPDAKALAAFLARRRQADPERFPDLSLAVVKLLGAGEYMVVRAGAEPEGHFGLAVQGYTHSTAPNRRYADLVTQRLLKAALDDRPLPATEAELAAIAARCTERAGAATKVERRLRKTAAALLLSARLGDTFDALVTGASPKGTFVRLLTPPAEGRVVRGEAGLDVGDRVRVRLVAVDPLPGFIDFERAG